MPANLIFLGVGLALAPVFTFTPLLQRMGWFTAALFHESGHFAAAVLTGCPAVPTISLTMQGCTPVRGQWPLLALAVWAGLVWLAAIAWHTRRLRWLALAAVIVHPLVTWNGEARQLFIILGGHLGELVFAGVALWRARTGGFTDNPAERML